MQTVRSIINHAEKHCKSNGSRLTQKRKQVLEGLLQSEKALSAYELADYCAKKFDQSLPAMSVYRILEFLQQEQLVHKLNLANKYVACSHITCDHAHDVPQFLICSNCQRVEEISINKSMIEELQLNVEEAGFHLASPQLEMNCICDQCIDKK
ncbi:MAG: transcriptional repressor [Kangiellaceae bacterium]|nr:transcriptional repressor [Kangiellaceae bacterium]